MLWPQLTVRHDGHLVQRARHGGYRPPMFHAVSAEYLVELARFVAPLGVSTPALLGDDFAPVDLEDRDQMLDGARFFRTLLRAEKLSGLPAFGVAFGRELGFASHGYLGYLARSCATLREVLTHDARYLPTRVTALHLAFTDEPDGVLVQISSVVPLGDAWGVTADMVLGTLWRVAEDFLGEPIDVDQVRADKDGAVVSLRLPAQLVERPLRFTDERLKALVARACEESLDLLGERSTTTQRLREELARDLQARPGLPALARRLAMSERTLRRRLTSEGSSFQELVEEVRERQARRFLKTTELTVEEISWRVGFASSSSFCQAFKRWTGLSPSEFRKQQVGRVTP